MHNECVSPGPSKNQDSSWTAIDAEASFKVYTYSYMVFAIFTNGNNFCDIQSATLNIKAFLRGAKFLKS